MVDVDAQVAPETDYLGKEDARQARQVVNNYIYRADVRGSATFGFGAVHDADRRTGRVGTRELARLDRFFYPPPNFREIVDDLRRHRIVLLTGRGGTGRRAGGLQLLRAVAQDLPLLSLTPTTTFAELCAKDFHASGYLLADKASEPLSRSQLDEIAESLKVAQAYLVVTMNSRDVPADLADEARAWQAPNPADLLAAYLAHHGGTASPAQRQATEKQLPAEATPSQVVGVGERLAAGQSSADALGALSAENAARVAQWFDQSPKLNDLQFIAALAFLDGTAEAPFEQALGQLKEVMMPGEPTGEVLSPDAPVPQSRFEQFSAESLAMVTPETDAYGTTGYRVGLREFVNHEQLVACLRDRYGRQLWEPITDWLRLLARRRDAERQAAIGRGVAQLWKTDRASAESSFLTPWSKGTASEQLTAVFTLSWLGLDATTEDAALKCAVRWASRGTAAQRRTAVVAFGGALGLRYPGEALKWLWRSATIATNVRELELARSSTVQFCADFGSDPETLARLFRQILTLARRLPPGPQTRRDAFKLIAEILGARSGGRRLPTMCLQQVPLSASVLGGLWAGALVMRPARSDALEALCACLQELERGSGPAPVTVVRDLGRSLLEALPNERERVLLYQDVERRIRRSNRSEDDRNRRILHALQEAF